jgi:DNA-binding transcriptional regulator YiaG
MKKRTRGPGPSGLKASERDLEEALRRVDADKEWLADIKDALQAKNPQDAKRFIVPNWYLAPGAIKSLRRQLKVSQSQLAGTIGVNVKTVQLWEQKTGAMGPGSVLLKLLMRYPGLYAELRA